MDSALTRKVLTAAMTAELLLASACYQPGAGDTRSSDTSKNSNSSSQQPATTPLPVGGSFLVDADLKPTPNYTQAKKSREDLEKVLNQARILYVNQPESEITVPPGFENCYSELDSFTMDANKVSAKMVKTLDISSCVKLATDKSIQINSIKATLEIYLYMTCTVGDLSGLQGKPFREMSNNLIAKSGCEDGSLHIEFLSYTNASAVYPGGISTTFKRRTVSLDGTGQLKGCNFKVKDKIETRDNECINYAKDDYSFSLSGGVVKPFSDLYKFQFQNALGDFNSANNIWRSQGKMQLSVNNWAGAVSFTNPTTAPTYEAKDQTTTASATGQLVATPPSSDAFVPATINSNIDPSMFMSLGLPVR